MLRSTLVGIASLALLACEGASTMMAPDQTPAIEQRARTLGTGNGITSLGLPAGTVSGTALAVNNDGEVVGFAVTSTGASVAWRWRTGGQPTPLPKPLGYGETMAHAINDLGIVAGSVMIPSGDINAAYWFNGQLTELGTLPGGRFSSAYSVNGRGQIAGSSEVLVNGTLVEHGFLYTPGQPLLDLGTLPGGRRGSTAQDVNDAGTVVGGSFNAEGFYSAFKWTATGGMVALPALAGQRESYAMAINDAGDIAGFVVMASDNRSRAVVWPRTGGIAQLGGLANNVSTLASDINDRGEIAGYSEVNNSTRFTAAWWTRNASGVWGSAVDLKAAAKAEQAYAIAISQGRSGSPTHVAGLMTIGGADTPTLWK